MALLSDADRANTSADYMTEVSSIREPFGALTKADIRAAVDALDSFLEANATAVNSAIPQPARSALTITQKARLLKFVITKRYISGA